MSAKRILFYFQPNLNRFRTSAGAVHDERAEWTSAWHCLCSKIWNSPRMEVETLWVSTWKKDIRIENTFDWVEGVSLTQLDYSVVTQEALAPQKISRFFTISLICMKLYVWFGTGFSLRFSIEVVCHQVKSDVDIAKSDVGEIHIAKTWLGMNIYIHIGYEYL